MIKEIRKNKHSTISVMDGEGKSVNIYVDKKPYAKANFIGDFMVLDNFENKENIAINSLFLDTIEENRYLLVKIHNNYCKTHVKNLEQYINLDEEYSNIPTKIFEKAKISVDN